MPEIKKIKVLMMSMHLPPDFGGGGEQMMRLASALCSRGVQCTLLAGTANREAAGFKSGSPDVIRVYTPGKMKTRNFYFLLKSIGFILTRGRAFDVLHLTSMNWAALAAIAAMSFFGRKTILKFSLRGVDDPITVRNSTLGGVKYKILKKLNRYISTSSELIEEIKTELPDFSDKLVLIRNGVDTSVFRPPDLREKAALRLELGLPETVVVYCFSGAVNRRKGIDVLVEAWSKFDGRDRAVLVIVGPVNMDGKRGELSVEGLSALGSTPEYVNEVLEIMHVASLDKSVVFTGGTDRVRDWLAASDVFVFPSRREGLPNAPAEAMACGLPVIASDIAGCRDLVNDGENGFLFEMDNSSALAEKMNELHKNEKLRGNMGEVSLKIVAKEYSMDSVAEKYIKMYEEICAGGNK